jgi:CelD/BcsL family acetyltransferase involved in cellulose biosynthesis
MTTRVTVVRTDELGPDDARRWSQFQQQTDCGLNPFMSLTFARTVGQSRSAARVAIIEIDGEIEAYLPFETALNKIATPIGWPMNDLHGFVQSGVPFEARTVIRKAGLRGWRFDHAPTAQSVLQPFSYQGTTVRAALIPIRSGLSFYDLTGDEAATTAKRRTAKKRRWQRRAIERELGEPTLEWHSSRVDDLRQMIAWKCEKYHGSRQLFSDPTTFSILDDLLVTNEDDCRGVLNVLRAGEQRIAIHFGVAGREGLSWWFTSYGEEFGRFSPGIVLLLDTIEAAAEQRVSQIDLGYGQDSWKSSLASDSYEVSGGGVWSNRAEELGRRLYRTAIYDSRPMRDRVTGAVNSVRRPAKSISSRSTP